MVTGEKAILRIKIIQSSLLQSHKMTLDCEAKLAGVYDSSNLNLVKGQKAIAVSSGHAESDSGNTMGLKEVSWDIGLGKLYVHDHNCT